jgi:hypothetical protein
LQASVSLARLLRDNGRRDESRTMLVEIYKWFTEGFHTVALKEAKALIDELSLGAVPSPRSPFDSTTRMSEELIDSTNQIKK